MQPSFPAGSRWRSVPSLQREAVLLPPAETRSYTADSAWHSLPLTAGGGDLALLGPTHERTLVHDARTCDQGLGVNQNA